MTDLRIAPGLYLVATPIGNLEDITLRALRVLRQADRIACEDTRTTSRLLHHYAITTPTVSYHLFNEQSRTQELIADLNSGARIAIVSDAGTPGIADPGAPLVEAAVSAGIDVFPVPGPNAALSALIASGLPAESFTFHGFLPAKSGQRRTFLELLPKDITHIFYEAPHRILDTLADIASIFSPAQPVVLARELTKLHEEFIRTSAAAASASLASRPQVRGEFVLLLHLSPEGAIVSPRQTIRQAVADLMQDRSLTEMDALKQVARERGIGKSEAYRELQREQPRSRR